MVPAVKLWKVIHQVEQYLTVSLTVERQILYKAQLLYIVVISSENFHPIGYSALLAIKFFMQRYYIHGEC